MTAAKRHSPSSEDGDTKGLWSDSDEPSPLSEEEIRFIARYTRSSPYADRVEELERDIDKLKAKVS